MKTLFFPARFLSAVFLLALFSMCVVAQTDSRVVRTKSMSKTAKFGPGGTIVLTGAPDGSIKIEGWQKHEVMIEAEIIATGATEEDAARVASVTGFYVDEDITSLRIHSVGPHDKKYLKKVDKKFPKSLRKNAFSINYTIHVPYFIDMQIDGGKGAFHLSNIEGSIRANFLESDAELRLVGGNVQIVIGIGSVDCTIATRSWRGRQAEIQLSTGEINLRLPKNLNADLEARILRTGKIIDNYKKFEPKPRTEFTETSMSARTGNGGAQFALSVGDGNLNIYDSEVLPSTAQ